MSDANLLAWLLVAASLLFLTVVFALAPDPLPERVRVPSPVDGCREATHAVSWSGHADSVNRIFICPAKKEGES